MRRSEKPEILDRYQSASQIHKCSDQWFNTSGSNPENVGSTPTTCAKKSFKAYTSYASRLSDSYKLGCSSEAERWPVKPDVEISKFSAPAGLGFILLNLQDKEKVTLRAVEQLVGSPVCKTGP